ncbi:hypothetical protein [Enhygromyxa salina]|uniref:Cytochrome c domain-containing protein n=1 Tax=Enhygromyxa salina TaxID=215803 RepID=A0A2S9Y634_9BACT|nr:hypothetical protein [Enhygromyxa salina]PRQ00569.1 hypothetical protein ENSA7_60630 [Enhygromyxa salina]
MTNVRNLYKKHYRTLITLTIAAFVLGISPLASADDSARRKKIVECINKELEMNNSGCEGCRLTTKQLTILTKIVDAEIMKAPLKKPTPEEEQAILKKIEDAAKAQLGEVPTETLDKVMTEVKKSATRCTKEAV